MSSSASVITLSSATATLTSVTVLATTQTVLDTGEVIIYNTSGTEITRSSQTTVPAQSSTSITVTGLSSGTAYTAKWYSEDYGGFSDSELSFSTLNDTTKLYGPVEAQTLTAVSGAIRSGGAGNIAAFDGDTFLSGASSKIDSTKTVAYLSCRCIVAPETGQLLLYYTDSSYTILANGYISSWANYGVTVSNIISTGYDYIDLTPTYTTSYTTKEITKLYGPVVSGQALTAVTGTVRSGYSGWVVSFDGEQFIEDITSEYPSILTNGKTVSYIWCVEGALAEGYLRLYYTDGTYTDLKKTPSSGNGYGVGLNDEIQVSRQGYIDLTPTYTPTSYITKEITKLYGPVSDGGGGYVTKLIYPSTVSAAVITLKAQGAGTMTVYNKWNDDILVENVTQGTSAVTVASGSSTAVTVAVDDEVTVTEGTANSTFRSWANVGSGLAIGVNSEIIDMPSMDRFTTDVAGTTAGNYFFYYFCAGSNSKGVTALPTGSFDISNITSVGNYFFVNFNASGALASLPAGSFDTGNITSVGNYFFSSFNALGALASLPAGSFDTGNITSVGNYFFSSFNIFGQLTSLPAGSFNTSNINGSVGDGFFNGFNYYGALTSLPAGSFNTSNINGSVGDGFFNGFNYSGQLTKSTSSHNANFINSSSSAVTAYYSGSTTAVSIAAGDPFYYYQA